MCGERVRNMKGLPKSFFEKARTNVKDIKTEPKKQQDIDIPFAWSRDVLNGTRKVVVKLTTK